MKIHMLVSSDRYRCGKRPRWDSQHMSDIAGVTCKPCIESYKYDNGEIREYRLGGNFDNTGKHRKISNQWDYKKEIKALEQRLKEADSILRDFKNLDDYADLYKVGRDTQDYFDKYKEKSC